MTRAIPWKVRRSAYPAIAAVSRTTSLVEGLPSLGPMTTGSVEKFIE